MARKMKDSGIEWIGEIPEGWEVIPAKFLFKNSDIRRIADDEQLTSSQQFGIISQKDYTELTGSKVVLANKGLADWKHVEPFDFIISLRSFQGGLEMSEITGCITWHYIVLKPCHKICSYYYKWLFKSDSYIRALQRTCSFIRDGQDLRYSNFIQVPLFEPPLAEQEKIADYLNAECFRIDAMLTKTRTSIEEYKKLKQAVITQAVTKGVRGEREMKDSGVEWIGEIPAEWSITKIKSGVTKIGSGKTPSGGAETYTDSGVIFLRSQNVYDCTLNLESPTYISPEVDATMKSTRVLPDDVLLNITGGSIGRCSIVPKTLGLANVNQHVCIIRTNPLIFLPKYMQYFWVSTLGHLAIDLYQTGGNREGMSADAIRNTPIPYAPLNEQKEIADYLDAKCAEIDGLIAKKEQLVKELESYKKSLIYEVVTGKREV